MIIILATIQIQIGKTCGALRTIAGAMANPNLISEGLAICILNEALASTRV